MDALRVKGVLNYSSLGDIHDKIPELHPVYGRISYYNE